MSMFRRLFFFGAINIAIMITISFVLSLLGVNGYITEYGINYKSLMIFCLVWGMGGSFISLLMSKWMAKKMMGVQIFDGRGEHAKLVNMVHSLAKAAHLPKMPEVGVYNSPEVNAFATGPSKSNSLVAVSTGLLAGMSEDELEGVLGHEIAHIANGDMVTMTLLQGVINAFVMFFARIAAFAVQQAMRGDDDDAPIGGGWAYMLTTIAFEMLFGILGMVIISFFSRFREYRADQGGARLAGREKMIAALQRLQSQHERGVFEKSNENMAALKISSRPSGFRALFSTHPALDKRISALQSYKTV